MRLRTIFTVISFLVVILPAYTQLNGPEKIFVDSLSHYPETGLEIESGYLIGGQEGNCNIATIWQMDEGFHIIRKKQLIHKKYEVSEVYDMKRIDSSFHILTRQLQIENAASDDGIKWYELNSDLIITDSLYLPWLEPKNGLILDSTWIINSWRDSLYSISSRDGRILHKVRFQNGSSDLKKLNKKIVTWNRSDIIVVDSVLQIDTLSLDENIIDIETFYHSGKNSDSEKIYILTENYLWCIENINNEFVVQDSVFVPDGAEFILYHPINHELSVVTKTNSIYYFTAETLSPSIRVQLFHDTVYQEILQYQVLKDGSILRMGTTAIKVKTDNNIMYGKEFGFFHRFNKRYEDATVSRSNLSLENLSISDPYYGSKPRYILGDTVYIITKDQDTEMNWQISNTGADVVQGAVVSTNTLWGFNCESGYNSRFYSAMGLFPGDSIKNTFTVYENSAFPHGWERRRFLYTGFPNGHYDADFSDNLKRFTLRYIISSTKDQIVPSLINVYPNPTRNRINIEAMEKAMIKQVNLLDTRGRTIQETTKVSPVSLMGMDVSPIPDGMYILRVFTSKGFITKKISVIH